MTHAQPRAYDYVKSPIRAAQDINTHKTISVCYAIARNAPFISARAVVCVYMYACINSPPSAHFMQQWVWWRLSIWYAIKRNALTYINKRTAYIESRPCAQHMLQ